MFKVGQIISYLDLVNEEQAHLQKGMNFRLRGAKTIILMSTRKGSPYNDDVQNDGAILVYEGHDIPKSKGIDDPKKHDQELYTKAGSLTDNGKFYEAVRQYQDNLQPAEKVTVYEKIKPGIWVYNGIFRLTDAWIEISEKENRKVCKFRLELTDDQEEIGEDRELQHNRIIPSHVKQTVWKRDGGKCVMCGSTENLHFDHIIPFSKGGSSLTADNIQLLCAKHNLQKHDRIE